MSHFGTRTHRPRYVLTSKRNEHNLRVKLGAAKAT